MLFWEVRRAKGQVGPVPWEWEKGQNPLKSGQSVCFFQRLSLTILSVSTIWQTGLQTSNLLLDFVLAFLLSCQSSNWSLAVILLLPDWLNLGSHLVHNRSQYLQGWLHNSLPLCSGLLYQTVAHFNMPCIIHSLSLLGKSSCAREKNQDCLHPPVILSLLLLSQFLD